jgi:hypothetical protein
MPVRARAVDRVHLGTTTSLSIARTRVLSAVRASSCRARRRLRVAGLVAATAAVACRSATPWNNPPLKPGAVAADVGYLASGALEGRSTGTRGNDSAAVFLARRHFALGLPGAFSGRCAAGVPADACGWSYFQYFKSDSVSGHNVGAYVRGSDPDLLREFVVVGAHYDHIGMSPRFALDPDLLSSIRPGADDNASGTAALLELARRLAASPPPRSILLIHFDAAEWGLVGSRAFVQQPPIPASTIVFMLNLDMIGRLKGQTLLVDGSVADAPSLALAYCVSRSLRVPTEHTGSAEGLSDHTPFASIGVPALSLTSGYHLDYHRVTDVARTIDLYGVGRVIDVAEGIVRAAAARNWRPRRTALVTR